MSNTNTVGPAFPFPAYTYPNGEINHGEDGMTLRDYFAGQALVGLLAGRQPSNAYPPEHIAETSYALAEALLKARGH